MSKFEALVNILDQIRAEGTSLGFLSYGPSAEDLESINQARARAYIHLYLKVKFGLLDFSERDGFITDGPQDGGIDGYFIDKDAKTIHLIQSKFRTSEANFSNKKITLNEISAMDVGRISSGEQLDEKGVPYSGKIKRLMREISEIEDVGRYKYHVTIIANTPEISNNLLRNLRRWFSS